LTFFILARNQCTSTDTSSRELVFLFDNLRNVGYTITFCGFTQTIPVPWQHLLNFMLEQFDPLPTTNSS
jgi:hypothetical protein